MDVAQGQPAIIAGILAQVFEETGLVIEEVESVVAHHEIDRRAGDRPVWRAGIEADELRPGAHDPVAGDPELGEDHVGSSGLAAAALELPQVVADAAGKLEDAARLVPVGLKQRQSGQERRVTPTVQEIVADAAPAEALHCIPQRRMATVLDELDDFRRIGRRAVPPIILIDQQGSERFIGLTRVEMGQNPLDQSLATDPQIRDAIDDGPARTGAGIAQGMRHVGLQHVAGLRRSEFERDHGLSGPPRRLGDGV